MPNQSHEQDLVDRFVAVIRTLNGFELHNQNCRSQEYADIEFTLSGQRWAIEEKSHQPRANRYNTVHQFFGKLLKETGRQNRTDCNIAILIPKDGTDFYHDHFKEIDRCKFFGFGWLIPVHTVFAYDHSIRSVEYTSWENFYDNKFNRCSSGFPR